MFPKYVERGAYHWDWYRKNKHKYRDLVDFTTSQFQKPGSVLDVGCGEGVATSILTQKGFRVTGIDPEPEAIALAKQHSSGHFEVKKLEDVNKQYDYVLMQDVIEHLQFPELAILDLLRVTRYFAIISTPNATKKHKLDYHCWTEQQFLELFRNDKVEVLKSKPKIIVKLNVH